MKPKENNLPKGLFRRKDSPSIWAKFKVDGMRKPISFSTETSDVKLAEKIYAVRRAQALEGKFHQKPNTISLKDMVERAVALARKGSGYLSSVMNVVNFLGRDVAAKDVTPEDIEKYDAWRIKKAALSTSNREIGYLQSCYGVAIKKMRLNLEDPVKGFARHDETLLARDRFLSYEERQRLFSDPGLDSQMRDVYMFAMKTGLRQGELRDLKWADINWVDKSIKVKTLKKKKRGGAAGAQLFRHVPLFIYPLQILKKRKIEGWEQRSPYVFCNETGAQLSRHGAIVTALHFACVRNKIKNFRFHDFRHTFATDFLRAARDLKAFKSLSEIMGHSIEGMTAKYAHLFPEDKMNQINLLPLEPAFQWEVITPAIQPAASYAEATHTKQA